MVFIFRNEEGQGWPCVQHVLEVPSESQVFCLYNEVANLGDVVIQKQPFAIGDTRAPVIPTPLSVFL
jgi:hypothetical protein